MIMYFYLLMDYKKQWNKHKITAPFFAFIIFLIPYSILNSAILNRGVYLLIFVFFGITVNLFKKETV